jgi:hypothetical protein
MPDPMLKVLVTVVRSPSIRVKSRDPKRLQQALEVAGNSWSSRQVRALSRVGAKTFFTVSPLHVNRLPH